MNGGSLSNRSCTSTVILGDLGKQDNSSGERKRYVPCTSWAVPLLLYILREDSEVMKSATLVAMIDNDLHHELQFAFQIRTVRA